MLPLEGQLEPFLARSRMSLTIFAAIAPMLSSCSNKPTHAAQHDHDILLHTPHLSPLPHMFYLQTSSESFLFTIFSQHHMLQRATTTAPTTSTPVILTTVDLNTIP
jgi:hypothetical protein